ncbi:hypothetical protein N7448_005817 [Penicillium atrosanguineum]|uniref:Uncharacterized protein n=1 Tax=Penicillium atrosanguineum TaxID=1132637 RepID=A0A9W9PQH3_9EURO|nr:uncharacterized protein N7443_009580 [Penicillium atrosanguineum]KAJ5131659.1 hypothetical protein N7448_005817 [Penicillium atrosanguineum]KAJ5138136.1 hypothetical protein N7526_004369 [Penicillium atrosanguineum]KAJ5289327.1 hypothetical protein N7443_009580 [Penicillium atrosanguineum]KAJ5307141.1 hypothetical protein N7476_007797 [Penicillium atrosanguineum]
MSSILNSIGLRAAPGEQAPNFAAGFLVANWVFAYALMSTRGTKMRYGLDNNVAPREDLSKYGEAAVKAGKISQRALNKLKRQEAAHANAVEGYPLFVAAMLLSVVAGVPHETINTIGVWYTLSRVAYSLCYSHIESRSLSYLRSVTWWSGNISCITGLVLAGKKL